jgi:hypothetical protein
LEENFGCSFGVISGGYGETNSLSVFSTFDCASASFHISTTLRNMEKYRAQQPAAASVAPILKTVEAMKNALPIRFQRKFSPRHDVSTVVKRENSWRMCAIAVSLLQWSNVCSLMSIESLSAVTANGCYKHPFRQNIRVFFLTTFNPPIHTVAPSELWN